MLADHVSVTEWLVLLTPLPETAIELGEFVALLAMLMFPVTLPVTCGANSTFNIADWPAAMVAPAKPLLTLNPLPLTLIEDTVTLELPLFVTVTPTVLITFSSSLPKFRLLLDSDRLRVVVLPVPLRLIV